MITPAQGSCAYCWRAVRLTGLEPCCDRPDHAGRRVCADVRGCVGVALSRLHLGAVMLTADDARSVVAALKVAAEAKRDAADVCAECGDDPEECAACAYRLAVADEWDTLRDRLGEATR